MNNIQFPPSSGGGGGAVSSVAGKTGAVTLVKADVGLDQVDNTSDANKPISTLQQVAIDYNTSLGNSILTQNGVI